MARASRPYRPRRMQDPDKLARQLAGWALLPDIEAKREAYARDLAAREESARQQREAERMAAALRHYETLQRHQWDAARFNALADALLNPVWEI
jgi:hypothetical protein